MSRNAWSLGITSVCFPRVSGDEPAVASVKYADLMFSPRERG